MRGLQAINTKHSDYRWAAQCWLYVLTMDFHILLGLNENCETLLWFLSFLHFLYGLITFHVRNKICKLTTEKFEVLEKIRCSLI